MSRLYLKLSEEMKGTCEENEYRKNPETNFTLSAKTTKINQTSNKKVGGKYETIISHLV
jgi:hypothetical protein